MLLEIENKHPKYPEASSFLVLARLERRRGELLPRKRAVGDLGEIKHDEHLVVFVHLHSRFRV